MGCVVGDATPLYEDSRAIVMLKSKYTVSQANETVFVFATSHMRTTVAVSNTTTSAHED